ncbi:hypothetical protein A2982_02070 [candidate division WWE3 bacterium RIFCSPLOWO2_01_FULL_39_13]|uniref:Major facilitator superfamily (MFS) profile domain-containing protein n=1 Tax=candidate division WWE3 bacterium RIFCSPLOWO2_01_FULL_39_13 TaxID=1802624 RepID=A0A1F4V3A6_UNCKA|nr:MAG: hypothetical protein A2982_02070 [candidate division WWE3 bacterium RIFCSPLOWO2_01_FULL_39_13]
MRLSHRNFRNFFGLHVNPVVKVLTISDIFILSGFGLVAPIFAVFITDNIKDGSVEVAGIAATVFFLSRSLGQIPAAYIVDKIKGEKDDFWAVLIGSIVTSFVPLLYIFATLSWHIYLIQLIYGFSQAFTYPSWYALFTRHVGHNREGVEWGIYSTLTDLGGAAVAGIGGYLAANFGFNNLFVIVSIASFVGSFWLIAVKRYIK